MIARMIGLLSISILAACSGSGMGEAVRKDITSQMEKTREPIGVCYEDALKRNRKLKGQMVLSFKAAPKTGKFSDISVVRNDLPDEALQQCVLAKVGEQALTKPQKSSVAVTYPLNFTATK